MNKSQFIPSPLDDLKNSLKYRCGNGGLKRLNDLSKAHIWLIIALHSIFTLFKIFRIMRMSLFEIQPRFRDKNKILYFSDLLVYKL